MCHCHPTFVFCTLFSTTKRVHFACGCAWRSCLSAIQPSCLARRENGWDGTILCRQAWLGTAPCFEFSCSCFSSPLLLPTVDVSGHAAPSICSATKLCPGGVLRALAVRHRAVLVSVVLSSLKSARHIFGLVGRWVLSARRRKATISGKLTCSLVF